MHDEYDVYDEQVEEQLDPYDDEIAREIADKVMKVKDEYDRIGGLYEMAYKGALAGLTYWANA